MPLSKRMISTLEYLKDKKTHYSHNSHKLVDKLKENINVWLKNNETLTDKQVEAQAVELHKTTKWDFEKGFDTRVTYTSKGERIETIRWGTKENWAPAISGNIARAKEDFVDCISSARRMEEMFPSKDEPSASVDSLKDTAECKAPASAASPSSTSGM